VKPRSATQITFDRTHSRRSFFTCAVGDPDHLRQDPFAQVLLHLPDQAGVGGVPGPGPHPDRDAVAGDRHPDDDLREVVAGVLGLAVGAEPGLAGFLIAAGRDPFAPVIARNVRIRVFRLEIRAGRVEEKEVYFQVQQVGDLVIRLFGQVGLDGQQVVHRPVAGIVGDLVEAVDVHVAADPCGGGELGGGGQGAVGGQGEQHPLSVRAEPAAGQGPADDLIQPEAPPHLVQDVRAAGRARSCDRQLARLRRR